MTEAPPSEAQIREAQAAEAAKPEATASDAPAVEGASPSAAPAANAILIHVYFNPDATVRAIGEKPATISEEEWFKRLNEKAGEAYQPLAGGRGVFRLDRARFDALRAAALH